MNIKELLNLCAESIDPDYPELNHVNLVWPDGKGRFPFAGKGCELLSEEKGRRVYAVDVEVVFMKMAKMIAAMRKQARERPQEVAP